MSDRYSVEGEELLYIQVFYNAEYKLSNSRWRIIILPLSQPSGG